MQTNFRTASLNRSRTPRSVLLRMAADADRAQRLKELKAERPTLRWRHLAEAADVDPRSVANWAKTGGMSYENAEKVAKYLKIDPDWLWRGPQETTDLMGALSGDKVRDQLDRIERMLTEQSATPSLDGRLQAIEQTLAGLREALQDIAGMRLEQELEDAAPPPAQQEHGTGADAPGNGQTRQA